MYCVFSRAECWSSSASNSVYFCYSPDGKLLASVGGDPDYMLTLWDWKQEKIVLRSKAFSQDIFRITFSTELIGQLTTSGVGHIRYVVSRSVFSRSYCCIVTSYCRLSVSAAVRSSVTLCIVALSISVEVLESCTIVFLGWHFPFTSSADCTALSADYIRPSRAFSVAGPTVWNSLPTEFRSLSVGFGDFRRTLKIIVCAILVHSVQ